MGIVDIIMLSVAGLILFGAIATFTQIFQYAWRATETQSEKKTKEEAKVTKAEMPKNERIMRSIINLVVIGTLIAVALSSI